MGGKKSYQYTAVQPAGIPADLQELENFARSLKAGKDAKRYVHMSDLVSIEEQGKGDGFLQWVQLVMAGGGVLGIAHVGFVRMLELAGIRFLGVGGASAGAINAVLVAATRRRPDEESWQATQDIMLGNDEQGRPAMQFDLFEDGNQWYKDARAMAPELKKTMSGGLFQWAELLAPNPIWAAKLVGSIMPELPGVRWLPSWSLPSGLRIFRQLNEELGAHPGVAFLDWMKDTLNSLPRGLPAVRTWGDLLQRMRLRGSNPEEPNIQVYKWDGVGPLGECVTEELDGRIQDRHHYPLRLVVTELTTQSMVVFPRDADLLYALQDKEASPADFTRASMSIPLFFKPFKLPYFTENFNEPRPRRVQVGRLLDAGVRSDAWQERNGYSGVVPEEAVFCDGGMLSNFPMRLFHNDWVEDGRPLLPTIGVQLGSILLKTEAVDVSGAGGLLGSVLDTARRNMDRTFLRENQEYKDTLAVIDCDDFDWLEFDIAPEKRQELLRVGMVAAAKFLAKWVITRDAAATGLWSTYKRRRRLLSQEPEGDGD